MTTDCLLISAFLSILACFTCCKPIIVQKIKTILDSQELVKTLKPTNKWSPSFGLIEENMMLSPISKGLEYLGGPGGRSRNFGNYWRSRGLEKSSFDIFTFNSDLDGLINH